MSDFIKKIGGTKVVILIAVVLAAIAIFGITVTSTGGDRGGDSAEHGHSHD